jgi:pSer/pThr/pTyr-binding forkhead associated (FHA) protein
MNVKLLVVQGRPAGKVIRFGPGDYFLGRGDECHLRFNSDWVSRQHCLLRVEAATALLRDLGSRNGTLVNGVLLANEQTLAQGDQIQIGPVVFQISFEEEAGAAGGSTTTLLPPEGEPSTADKERKDTAPRLPPLLEKD